MTGELAALNTNWLETPTVANATETATCTVSGSVLAGCGSTATYHYSYPWYVYIPYAAPNSVNARPIRLTLKDVERLRLAAKRDAKLKAILEKFTDQIEVELSFE